MDPVSTKEVPTAPKKLVENITQLCEYVDTGHSWFIIEYVRPDGKLIKDSAQFDTDDPVSYHLVESMLANPNVKLWVKLKR